MKVVDMNRIEYDVEQGSLEDMREIQKKIETDPISKQRFNEAKNSVNHRAIDPETFQPVFLYGGKAYALEAMQDWAATGEL